MENEVTHAAPFTVYSKDFVNRQAALGTILENLEAEQRRPLLLVSGEHGIGKSYLLFECLSQCDARDLTTVHLDLGDGSNGDYLAVVDRIREHLGPAGFAPLDRALEEVDTLTTRTLETISANAGNHQPPPSTTPLPQQIGAEAQVIQGSGNVQIRTNVLHIWLREDPLVKRQIEGCISDGLYRSLQFHTAQRLIIFLIDHWDESTTELHSWFGKTLLSWILNGGLPNTMALICGVQAPTLPPRPLRIAHVALTPLTKEDIYTYWVEKRHLPVAQVEAIFMACQGVPVLMRMIADLHARRAATA